MSFTIRFMGNRKNDKEKKSLDAIMRFMRLCKLMLTDTGKQCDLALIDDGSEFHDLMDKWLKVHKFSKDSVDSRQTDTVIVDMLFDAWNDIDVGCSIDITVKVNEGRKDSKGQGPAKGKRDIHYTA